MWLLFYFNWFHRVCGIFWASKTHLVERKINNHTEIKRESEAFVFGGFSFKGKHQ